MTLCGCINDPVIKHKVLTPPPSAARLEFFVEKPEVQSRETGDEAWRRNAEYGRALADALKAALKDQGKSLGTPPSDVVRSKIYLGYGTAPVTTRNGRRAGARVEVRLMLHSGETGALLYSTDTRADVPPTTKLQDSLGMGVDGDTLIRETLEKAARDFASRL